MTLLGNDVSASDSANPTAGDDDSANPTAGDDDSANPTAGDDDSANPTAGDDDGSNGSRTDEDDTQNPAGLLQWDNDWNTVELLGWNIAENTITNFTLNPAKNAEGSSSGGSSESEVEVPGKDPIKTATKTDSSKTDDSNSSKQVGDVFGGSALVRHFEHMNKDYYYVDFEANMLNKMQITADFALKQVSTGSILPDRISGGFSFGGGSSSSGGSGNAAGAATDAAKNAASKATEPAGIMFFPGFFLKKFNFSIRNLADTIAKTGKNGVPLVIVAGCGIAVSPTGGGLSLTGEMEVTVKTTSLKIVGNLTLGGFKLFDEAMLKVQWVDPWCLEAKARVDLMGWHIIYGSAAFELNQKLFSGEISAALRIPKVVPIVGGLEVAKLYAGISTEKVWGGVEISLLMISYKVGVTHYWNGGDVKFDLDNDGKPKEGSYTYLLFTDEDTGEQQLLGLGNNLSTIATSRKPDDDTQETIYRDLGGGMQLLEFRANQIGSSDIVIKEILNDAGIVTGWEHTVPVGQAKGNTPADAMLQIEYFGAKKPNLTANINGKAYKVHVEGNVGDEASNITPEADTLYGAYQEREVDETVRHMAYVALPYDLLKNLQEDDTLTLTSDCQIDTALIRVERLADLDGVNVAKTGENTISATANVSYAKAGDTLLFYLSESNAIPDGTEGEAYLTPEEMPDTGRFFKSVTLTEEQAKAGQVSVDVDLTDVDGEDMRTVVESGTYYVRVELQTDRAFERAISPTPIVMKDPLAPKALDSVDIVPAGNGFFDVIFPAAATKTNDGTDVTERRYAIDFYQDGELFDEFSGLLLDPQDNADTLTSFTKNGETWYKARIGGRAQSDVVHTDDEGNVIDTETRYTGLETGKSYYAEVKAVNVTRNDGGEESWHASEPTRSKEVYLPIPVPPQLSFPEAEHVQTDEYDYYQLLTNAEKPSVKVRADADVTLRIVCGDETIAEDIRLENGVEKEIDLSAFESDGTFCLNLYATNVETGDVSLTALYLTTDHAAPILYIDSPLPGAYTSEGRIVMEGRTTPGDTSFLFYINDSETPVSDEDIDIEIGEDGQFSGSVGIPEDLLESESELSLRIVATDRAGNTNSAKVFVTNDQYRVVRGISLDTVENLVIPLSDETPTQSRTLNAQISYYAEGKGNYTSEPIDNGELEFSIYRGDSVILDEETGTVTPQREGASIVQATYTSPKGRKFQALTVVRTVLEDETELESIEVNPLPDKISYALNEELDLTGAKLIRHYADGSTGDPIDLKEAVASGDVSISTFNSSQPGKLTVTVTYRNKQTEFQVLVSDEESGAFLSKMTLTTPPRTQYLVGEELDLSKAVLQLTYSVSLSEDDDKTETTTFEELADYVVTGFDPSKPGKQVVTVTYKGQSLTFTVEVFEKVLSSIAVGKRPDKTVYVSGEELALDGFELTLIYNEGTEAETRETIPYGESGIDGFTIDGLNNEPDASPEQKLKITYQNKTTELTVIVLTGEFTGIALEMGEEAQKEYHLGEEFNPAGINVMLTYQSEGESPITLEVPLADIMDSVSGYDKNASGEQTVTVTLNERTATFNVTVLKKQLTQFTITALPNKTAYLAESGEEPILDLSGATAELSYDDGSTETISLPDEHVTYTISEGSAKNKRLVTLVYSEDDRQVEATYAEKIGKFEAEIISGSPKSIKVTKLPSRTHYVVGWKSDSVIDLTGSKITLTYEDDTVSGALDLKQLVEDGLVTVTGFSNDETGTKTVTVAYGDATDTFSVVISEIRSISIRNPSKMQYLEGEELNLTGGSVTITYTDAFLRAISMTDKAVRYTTSASLATSNKLLVTVYYGDDELGSFEVEILGKLPESVTVTAPDKTRYIVGWSPDETLDLTGSTLTLAYKNGSTSSPLDLKQLLDDGLVTITEFSNAETGVKTITVTYGELSATFDVTVVAVSSISLKSPDKTDYQMGETLDLTGGTVQFLYGDGTKSPEMPLTADMISGGTEDDLTLSGNAGTRTITVSVGGVENSFNITIRSLRLEVDKDGSYAVYTDGSTILSAYLLISSFSDDGKMIAVRSIPIALGTQELLSGTIPELADSSYNYSVILVDSNYVSLCEGVEIESVTE